MKKHLFSLLLTVLAVTAALGQTGKVKPVTIRDRVTGQALYEVSTFHEYAKFPLTQAGLNSFTLAVTTGKLSLSVTCPNGVAVVPVGTLPPKVSPCLSLTSAMPVWIAGLRYSHDGQTLTLEGAGNMGQIAFLRQDGQSFTTTNPDNVTIRSGDFYGYGTLSGQGIFNKRWQVLLPVVPMRLLIKQEGGQGQYSYSFTPVNGAQQQPLLTPVAMPSTVAWVSGLQYSHDGTTLSIEGAGNIGQMSFAYLSGQPFTTTNPDGVTGLKNDIFYPYGNLFNQAPFDRRWQMNLGTLPMKITAQKVGEPTSTVSYTFTPSAGQNRVVLVAPTSVTTTPPPSVTTAPPVSSSGLYARVFVLGNSINRHPSIGAWAGGSKGPWGMDASAADKDYYSLLRARIQTLNPNVIMRRYGDLAGTDGNEGSYWESSYWNIATDARQRMQNAYTFAPTTLIVRIAENVTDLSHGFKSELLAEINRFKVNNPAMQVVVTGSAWKSLTSYQVQVEAQLQQLASENNFLYASLDGVTGLTAGFGNHPQDEGMAGISDKIWSVLPRTTTLPSTVGPAGYGNVFAANSSYVPLAETARPTNSGLGSDPSRSFIDNGTARLGINLKVGSVIDWLSYDNSNSNRVNTPVWGNNNFDAGRQISTVPYLYPNGGFQEGVYTENGLSSFGPPGIGNNPVQGGNIGKNPMYGVTNTHSVDAVNKSIYVDVTPVQWELRNVVGGDAENATGGVLGQMRILSWLNFDPGNARVVRAHTRWVINRTDPYTSHFPTPRQQEMPCYYHDPSYSVHYYATGEPYTNAPLSVFPAPGSISPARISSEPLIISENPTTLRAIVLFLPESGRVTTGNWDNPNSGSFSSRYIGGAPVLSLDHQSNYDFDYAVGEFATKEEARAWVYAQPRWTGKYEYRFDNNAQTRHAMRISHATDQLEKNIVSGWQIRPNSDNEPGYQYESRQFGIQFPEKWIDATTNKHVFVNGSFVGLSDVSLVWTKLATGETFYKYFNWDTSGSVTTKDFDMSGEGANWSGPITLTIKRGRYGGYSSLAAGPALQNDQWNINWISYRNLSN